MTDEDEADLRQVGYMKASVAGMIAMLLPEVLEELEQQIVRWLIKTRATVTLLGHTPRPLADPLIMATVEDVVDVCINTHVPESAIAPLLRRAKQGLPLAVRLDEL